MKDYSKRLTEVSEILNYLSVENYEKIPSDVINLIEDNKDLNYNWKYDETKDFNEQDINEDTLDILAYINYEYLLNSEQREFMRQITNK